MLHQMEEQTHSLRSKSRPFFLVVVPSGKDNENIINTHMTQSKAGEYKGRQVMSRKISAPPKSWGLALFVRLFIYR